MNEPIQLVGGISEEPTARPMPSFELFFQEERTRLYRALCLITRNRYEAEELTQDAFVRVLEHWALVGLMDDATGYLYRTAMNSFRKAHRRAVMAAKRATGLTHQDDGLEHIESTDAAVRAMAILSPRQRAAVVLVDLLGYPSEEAAKILGVRAGTVRTHVARGHAALKETIRDE
jgi:RNA polymerase sigma factor (sigma-70 family)